MGRMAKPTELKELSDDVRDFLGDLTDWNLDVLELSELTNGRPLLVLSFAIVSHHELLLNIYCSNQTFSKFISRIEAGYLKNPYHNNNHAADVLNGCHHFVQVFGFKDVITNHQMFSLLISAAIHDFEHPGVSNNFLIRTKSSLAVQYNDDSVLERMHVARAFAIMQEEGAQCNILKGVSNEDYVSIRRTIIETVMMTDLSKHLDYTARVRSMAANQKSANMTNASVMLQIAIKSSDLGHCAKILPIHLKWTALITEEMYMQGDRERIMGLKVSAFCDRDHGDIPKSQVGFFTFIVNPFFSAIVDLDPRFEPIKTAVLENYKYWKQKFEGDKVMRRLSSAKLNTMRLIAIKETEKKEEKVVVVVEGEEGGEAKVKVGEKTKE